VNSFIEKNRSAAMIGLHDTVNRHSGMIYLMYRASTPCLSLRERRPSAARSEREETLRKHAGVDTLRKYANGIFLVSISAAMPLSLSKNASSRITRTGVL
jgi:hypothetical protein